MEKEHKTPCKLLSKDPRSIQGMFSGIVARYDLVNTFLSFGMDRLWRRRVASLLTPIKGKVLDLCTGTGKLVWEISKRSEGCTCAIGLDFSLPMLRKFKKSPVGFLPMTNTVNGDATALPFKNEFFDIVTASFGVRNVDSLKKLIHESFRVLKPGGRLAILEFSRPERPLLNRFHCFYLTKIVPAMGRLLTGHPHAYAYLSESIRRYPEKSEFARMMGECGAKNVKIHPVFFGTVAIHIGEK